jgi:hypothetical protein
MIALEVTMGSPEFELLRAAIKNPDEAVEITTETPHPGFDAAAVSEMSSARAKRIAAGERVAKLYRRGALGGRQLCLEVGVSHEEALELLEGGATWVGFDEYDPRRRGR